MKEGAVNMKNGDFEAIKSAPESLACYLITWWNTIMLAHFSCCAKRNRQLKRIKKGKANLNKHLDIVRLIRTSTDVSIIKKLLMTPKQRALMKKQRRYAFKLDSDDFPDSSDGDDHGGAFKNVIDTYTEEMTTLDRQLMLGVIARNNDVEPPIRPDAAIEELDEPIYNITGNQES